jgi:thiamine pyrophosphate-dependent acetolactate synthase large subunit-like protein
MAQKVADVMWEMLANAGVKRCYGIVGDALNPVIDALRRNGKIEFVHVRHEEYGVFAAVAEAYLSGNLVTVCGTAGPGVTHLFNGDSAGKVAIFGGDGCRAAREEVLQLAARLQAPVGYTFRGKQWLEHDNPNAVGMTGLLGYGGAYEAMQHADLLLLLGTDFPYSEFLPKDGVKKVQIDRNAKRIGRRTAVDLGLVGDIATTLKALLPKITPKTDGAPDQQPR